MLIFGRLHEKPMLKSAICGPVQNLHYSREEPHKSLIEFRGRRSCCMHTDFQVAVRFSRTSSSFIVKGNVLILNKACFVVPPGE